MQEIIAQLEGVTFRCPQCDDVIVNGRDSVLWTPDDFGEKGFEGGMLCPACETFFVLPEWLKNPVEDAQYCALRNH